MEDTILVGYVKGENSDNSILIVGRKRMNESVDVVNAFKGEKADRLYKELVSVEEENNDVDRPEDK